MASGRDIARAIAEAVGGEVRELPTAGLPEFLVVVPTGRVPASARDFGNGCVGACIPRGVEVVATEATVLARLPELIESARDWLARRDPEVVSMYGLAIALLEILETSLGERWIPTPLGAAPTQVSLQPPAPRTGTVGVHPTKVLVWIGTTDRTFPMTTLAELAAATPRILAAIEEQRAGFARNAITSAQIETAAERLTARLCEAGIPAKLQLGGAATHAGTLHARLACGNRSIVIDTLETGDAVVQIGPRGRDFSCALADVDAQLPDLIAALAASRTRLTLGDLRAGTRYRVLDGFHGTAPGDIVKFVGFDDLDNHYGEYIFETAAGERIAVGGDYCYPDATELGETHRYLAPIE